MSLKLTRQQAKQLGILANERQAKVTPISDEFRALFEEAKKLPISNKPSDHTPRVVVIEDWHPSASSNRLIGNHWTTGHRSKSDDARRIFEACLACGVVRATRKREVAYALAYAKGQKMHDPDAFDKTILDALVRCGALVDDGPKWVFQAARIPPVRADRMATRIMIRDCD